MQRLSIPTPFRGFVPALLATALLLAPGCASVEFTRESETSGQFVSTGFSITLLSVDFPKGALEIARENASDARLPNTVVDKTTVVPYLGPFNWLLNIVGAHYARIEGRWGFPPR